MRKIAILAALALSVLSGVPAVAQAPSVATRGGGTGTVTVVGAGSLTIHAPVVGGGSQTEKTTAAMTDGQLLVGATSADPAPKTISGDGTLSSAGALAVTKVGGDANVAFLDVNQAWTKGQAVTPDTATQCGTQSAAGTMTPNFAVSNSCVATFGAGNLTIANPTNVKAGQTWLLSLTQDGTGSRTVTWGTQYKWAGGTAPTLSTTASAKDVISCFSDTTTTHNCVIAVKGAS